MRQFNCVNESDLKKIYEHAVITDFNMNKLEVEYDYDTDCEQITHSKKMLFRELAQAIEFFITDDPIRLVGNLGL